MTTTSASPGAGCARTRIGEISFAAFGRAAGSYGKRSRRARRTREEAFAGPGSIAVKGVFESIGELGADAPSGFGESPRCVNVFRPTSAADPDASPPKSRGSNIPSEIRKIPYRPAVMG